MTRDLQPFAPCDGTLLAATRDAVHLRNGSVTAWFPRALFDRPSAHVLATAQIGAVLELRAQAWAVRERRWPDPKDRQTPDLFGG